MHYMNLDQGHCPALQWCSVGNVARSALEAAALAMSSRAFWLISLCAALQILCACNASLPRLCLPDAAGHDVYKLALRC